MSKMMCIDKTCFEFITFQVTIYLWTLMNLLTKAAKSPMEWTEDCKAAFRMLKEKICSSPALTSTRDSWSRWMRQPGVGAVLAQGEVGAEKPVVYISRQLLPRETRYSTVEKECLAIKWSLKSLRYYLLGREFDLETDHRALTWIQTMKDHNSRVMRWYLSLQPYKFKVRHRPGQQNVVADYLSRYPDSTRPREGGCDEVDIPAGSAHTHTHTHIFTTLNSPPLCLVASRAGAHAVLTAHGQCTQYITLFQIHPDHTYYMHCLVFHVCLAWLSCWRRRQSGAIERQPMTSSLAPRRCTVLKIGQTHWFVLMTDECERVTQSCVLLYGFIWFMLKWRFVFIKCLLWIGTEIIGTCIVL